MMEHNEVRSSKAHVAKSGESEEHIEKELVSILENYDKIEHYRCWRDCHHLEIDKEFVEDLKKYVAQECRKARIEGEVAKIKELRQWAEMHQIGVLPSDFDHMLKSREQFPGQPTAYDRLAELKGAGISDNFDTSDEAENTRRIQEQYGE